MSMGTRNITRWKSASEGLWNRLCMVMVKTLGLMKTKHRHILSSVLLAGFLCIFNANAQVMKPKMVDLESQPLIELPERDQAAFGIGEKLTYRLHYGFVDAGEAVVEVKETKYSRLGRPMFHVEGKGRTLGAFNWFFKVRDRYESYIDQESLLPWKFIRRIDEGGYEKSQDYIFHHHRMAVDNGAGITYEIPTGAQDMISAFYYARTLDFTDAAPGDEFTIQTFMDDEIYDLRIRYLGKEELSLRTGDYRCMKFVPIVQEGRIFKDSEDLQVWITDDENKIPILAKASILVGSIKMQLVEYEGLSHPIAKLD